MEKQLLFVSQNWEESRPLKLGEESSQTISRVGVTVWPLQIPAPSLVSSSVRWELMERTSGGCWRVSPSKPPGTISPWHSQRGQSCEGKVACSDRHRFYT